MSSYSDTLRAHRRLTVLTHLSGCAGYASNGEILRDVLNGVGIATSRDETVATLAWLDEAGLIDIEDFEGFVLATATGRGVDVAAGHARHPGVKRPAPKGR